MTIKTFSFGLVMAIFAAILAAGLVIAGNIYLVPHLTDKEDDGKPRMFSRATKVDNVRFTEVKNIVITLKNTQRNERYLLLELGLATTNDEQAKKVETIIPMLRSATVDLISTMDYQEARGISMPDLRKRLMETYRTEFTAMHLTVPFDDVVVSKMVFQ